MYGSRTVSVVFPAYNEGENIRRAVEDFFLRDVVDEIVVVDNNSRDATAASMMPAGLLDTLGDREVIDLVAYLRTSGPVKTP